MGIVSKALVCALSSSRVWIAACQRSRIQCPPPPTTCLWSGTQRCQLAAPVSQVPLPHRLPAPRRSVATGAVLLCSKGTTRWQMSPMPSAKLQPGPPLQHPGSLPPPVQLLPQSRPLPSVLLPIPPQSGQSKATDARSLRLLHLSRGRRSRLGQPTARRRGLPRGREPSREKTASRRNSSARSRWARPRPSQMLQSISGKSSPGQHRSRASPAAACSTASAFPQEEERPRRTHLKVAPGV